MDTVRSHSFSCWLRHHIILASFIVLVCSLAPRLFFSLHADPHLLMLPDSPTYLNPAKNLLESGVFYKSSNTPEISRTPAYPAFLATLMYVVGKDLRTLLVTQAIVLSSSVLILYLFARRILPPVMAFAGALLAAFSPWSVAKAGFLLTEGFYILVLALLFYLMSLLGERMLKVSTALLAGGCIGLMTSVVVLVRPVWPLVPLVGLVLFFLYGDKQVKSWVLIVAMLASAATPLYLWKTRNFHEAQFDGLSNTSGMAAYHYFTSAVKAQIKGQEVEGDRWTLLKLSQKEQSHWGLSNQEADDERWRRVHDVFQKHPFLSIYTFALNVGEAMVHPDPSILTPVALNFRGDIWVFGGIWAAMIGFAWLGLTYAPDKERDDGFIQRKWLVSILSICLLLTLTSGFSFGAGSRFRAPLELIVPLLAGVGLVRAIRLIAPHLVMARKWPFPDFTDTSISERMMKLKVSMTAPTRRQSTDTFKPEAVRLTRASGHPVAQVTKELGISDMCGIAGRGEPQKIESPRAAHAKRARAKQDELTRFKRKNETLKKERDFFR